MEYCFEAQVCLGYVSAGYCRATNHTRCWPARNSCLLLVCLKLWYITLTSQGWISSWSHIHVNPRFLYNEMQTEVIWRMCSLMQHPFYEWMSTFQPLNACIQGLEQFITCMYMTALSQIWIKSQSETTHLRQSLFIEKLAAFGGIQTHF